MIRKFSTNSCKKKIIGYQFSGTALEFVKNFAVIGCPISSIFSSAFVPSRRDGGGTSGIAFAFVRCDVSKSGRTCFMVAIKLNNFVNMRHKEATKN